MLCLADSHAHLSLLAERGRDVPALLEVLEAEGFTLVLDVGTRPGDLAARRAAYGSFPLVRFSAGVWPSAEAIADPASALAALEADIAAAGAGAVAAIGEGGLDRHWNTRENGADLEGELELLRGQAALALRMDKPFIVHSRDSAAETAAALSEFPGLRGVIHCFSYGPAEAGTFLDLGFHISFSGTVTYKNAASQREAAALVPEDRLLAETDSPYLAPVPHRGKAADPSMVALTVEALAAARGESAERIARVCSDNALALFGRDRSGIRKT